MAITRILNKPLIFKYEDILVGVKQPTVSEMQAVAKLRSAYISTLKDDSRLELANPSGVDPDGDASLLLAVQEFVAEILCCDPDNANELWFQQAGSNRTDRDKVSDVPSDFVSAAFATFAGIPNKFTLKPDRKTRMYPEATAEGMNAEVASTTPLSPEPTNSPETTSTFASDDKSSPSVTTSISTPTDTSESGSMQTSLIV